MADLDVCFALGAKYFDQATAVLRQASAYLGNICCQTGGCLFRAKEVVCETGSCDFYTKQVVQVGGRQVLQKAAYLRKETACLDHLFHSELGAACFALGQQSNFDTFYKMFTKLAATNLIQANVCLKNICRKM